MWTPRFPSVVDHHVSLVVREFEKPFLTQRAVILFILVTLFVLLQCILNLKLLPTGAAGIRLLMNPHVCLQLFWTTESFITFWTSSIVFFDVNLQMFVEIFRKGKCLLTVRTRVALAICCFSMGDYVPFQMIQSTKYFAAITTDEVSRAGLDLLM